MNFIGLIFKVLFKLGFKMDNNALKIKTNSTILEQKTILKIGKYHVKYKEKRKCFIINYLGTSSIHWIINSVLCNLF